jgi:hypothetical protein
MGKIKLYNFSRKYSIFIPLLLPLFDKIFQENKNLRKRDKDSRRKYFREQVRMIIPKTMETSEQLKERLAFRQNLQQILVEK